MSDKGQPFESPLAPGGSASGYQWIAPPPEPEPEPTPQEQGEGARETLEEMRERLDERRAMRQARARGEA
jgi:hypothetical protein